MARFAAGAAPQVLAQHVAGSDLQADGAVVFTNGFDICELGGPGQGQKRSLARQQVGAVSAI